MNAQVDAVEQLRKKANDIRSLAKYTSGRQSYKEMGSAKKLDAQAEKLEKTQKQQEVIRKKLVSKVKIAQNH